MLTANILHDNVAAHYLYSTCITRNPETPEPPVHLFNSSIMNTPDFVSYRDALDIVFATRNKTYGAYQLRRSYPAYLGKAFGLGLLLIALFLSLPHLLSALSGVLPKEQPVNVLVELSPPRDIDPMTPPPVPPPPPPTPPPPVRATVRYVPPVILEDQQVQEEPPKTAVDELDKSRDIGANDQEGDKDARPSDIPVELKTGIVESAPPPPEEKSYEMFDLNKPPTFPGGEKEMLRFLAENIKYPALARENNIQGNVTLSFIVGKDGTVSELEILKDIGGGCGKEAIRVVQTMPKWSAGEANGHPVKVRFRLPVRFRLE